MTREVVTVGSQETFSAAMALIARRGCHHLIVVNSDGKLVGVVSEQDLFNAFTRTPDWRNCEISQVMTSSPSTVTPETPLFVVVSKVLSKRYNSFPVIDADGAVAGILSSTDLLRAYQKMVDLLQRQLIEVSMIEFSL